MNIISARGEDREGEARAQYVVRVAAVRTPRRARVGYVDSEVPCECVSAV